MEESFIVHHVPLFHPLFGQTNLCPLMMELRFYKIVFKASPLKIITKSFDYSPATTSKNNCLFPNKISLISLAHSILTWLSGKYYVILPMAYHVSSNPSTITSSPLILKACLDICTYKSTIKPFTDPSFSPILNYYLSSSKPSKIISDPEPLESSLTTESILQLLRDDLQLILKYLIWVEDHIFKSLTYKAYFHSFPFFYASYSIWKRKINVLNELKKGDMIQKDKVQDKLHIILSILTSYLNASTLQESHTYSYLEAIIFSNISILLSLPLTGDFLSLISSHTTLIQFCQTINQQYTIWPSESTFLMALQSRKEKKTTFKDNLDEYNLRFGHFLLVSVICTSLCFLNRFS